ncbi:MAG: LysE family transporter [Candidatus Thorarchaeota archaeon]
MDVLLLLIVWWTLSLTGALAPGPLSAAVVMQATKRGRLYGMLPMVGHSLVELGIVGLLAFSISSVVLDDRTVAVMQGLGGVVVILFGMLALKDWRRPPDLDHGHKQPHLVNRSAVVEATSQGVIVSILSPYFILWWFAVGAGTVSTLMYELQVGVGTILVAGALIYLTHISTDFMFGAVLAVTTDEINRRTGRGGVNWLAVLVGAFQIALGTYFILLALT